MSPCDYRQYHRDWRWIVRQIKGQAGDRCEFCGVPNGAVGARDRHGHWHDEDQIHSMNSGVGYGLFAGEFPRMVRIVLTVAHVGDPDPMNIDPSNLRALCQRCHNRHDMPTRQAHAAETRLRKQATALAATGQLVMIVDGSPIAAAGISGIERRGDRNG